MTGADLVAEWHGALGGDVELLRLAGVPEAALALAQPVPAQIAVRGDLYEPDQDGSIAFLLPCRVYRAVSPEAPSDKLVDVLAFGGVVDIVAIHPQHPGRWLLRRGVAEWLGCVEPQHLNPEPVRIRRSPLSWLRAGCQGLLPLSRDLADIARVLNWCTTIVAEDEVHAAELTRILSRPWPHPEVRYAA